MPSTKLNNIFNKLIKNDFLLFYRKAFCQLTAQNYVHNHHIDKICTLLENQNCKRGIINIPPRYGKSLLINVAWPAWLLGHNPKLKIISVSYSQAIANKHSLDCRNIMLSEWFQQIFPNCTLRHDQNQKSKFMTYQNGFRLATSTEGSLTGEGADLIIIDDPQNPVHVHNSTQREKLTHWYQNILSSRLNDKKNGRIIVVMQRLHHEDLSGFLIKNGDWHLLKLPAIEDNVPLNPKRENLNELLKIKKEIGEYNFSAQYQQQPLLDAEQQIIKHEWINYYHHLPPKFDMLISSWDCANKIAINNDFSAVTIWGIYDNKYYLLDFAQYKLEFTELAEKITEYNNHYKVDINLIEDKASGQALIQYLKTKLRISAIIPRTNKISRLTNIIASFINEKILIPKNH